MPNPHLSLFSPFLLLAALAAQTTTYVAPKGYASIPGNGGNAIPLWCGSSVYQQVHDAADLQTVFPTPVAVIKAISFRIPNGGSLTARTVDAQVTMGTTTVSARTASTTFATNLGSSPVIVLPYTNLSLPAVSHVSNPNPQSWFFPFTAPYTYVIPTGNLCYELRMKNLSATGGSFDAISGTSARLETLIGTGCTASGQTSAATIGARSVAMSTGAFVNRLDRGAAAAPALMILGDKAQQIVLPGFCSALETLPLATLGGTTDATGSWNVNLSLGSLYYFPRVTIYTQFAWIDAGLPNGLGLSTCSPVSFPPPTQARIYFAPSGTGQGNETATTGSRELTYPYGLVMGFDT